MEKITIIGPRLQDIAGFKDNNINREIVSIIDNTIKNNSDKILLTSCALGIEMWACEAAIYHGMSIEMVIPCKDFDSKWGKDTRKIYSKVLKYATILETSDEPWSGKLMYTKDKYLCEQSDRIYHFYNVMPRCIPSEKSVRLFKDINDGQFFEF